MSSDVDVESQIQETAEDAVAKDGPFVPGVNCTNINDVSEFGDVEYYMWERYYIQNKSRGTIIQLSNAVTNLEKFIKQSDRFDCSVEDVDNRVAKQFKMWLVDRVQPSTAASYINELDSMAQFYLSDGYYPGNPFENLTDGINTSADDNSASYQTNERITVDDTKLREAIRSTHGSMKIVLLAVLVKTGIRLSEACNLDWEDINIDHPLADDLLPDSRFELSDDPDTIYIDSDKTHTTTDVYTAGNKRKVDSWIPIDNELKRLLLWHALTRERRFDGENPVLMVDDDPVDKPSNRLPTTTGWKRVKEFAEDYGWHGSENEKENVTPHWFRAKASSYLSNQLEADDDIDVDAEAVVKGIRGDKGDDVIQLYRLRKESFKDLVRSKMFKIGLEGI